MLDDSASTESLEAKDKATAMDATPNEPEPTLVTPLGVKPTAKASESDQQPTSVTDLTDWSLVVVKRPRGRPNFKIVGFKKVQGGTRPYQTGPIAKILGADRFDTSSRVSYKITTFAPHRWPEHPLHSDLENFLKNGLPPNWNAFMDLLNRCYPGKFNQPANEEMTPLESAEKDSKKRGRDESTNTYNRLNRDSAKPEEVGPAKKKKKATVAATYTPAAEKTEHKTSAMISSSTSTTEHKPAKQTRNTVLASSTSTTGRPTPKLTGGPTTPKSPEMNSSSSSSTPEKLFIPNYTSIARASSGTRFPLSSTAQEDEPARKSATVKSHPAKVSSTTSPTSKRSRTAMLTKEDRKHQLPPLVWRKEQDRQLHDAMLILDPSDPQYLTKLAQSVKGASVEQIREHMMHVKETVDEEIKMEQKLAKPASRSTKPEAPSSPLRIDADMSKKKNRRKLELAEAEAMKHHVDDIFADPRVRKHSPLAPLPYPDHGDTSTAASRRMVDSSSALFASSSTKDFPPGRESKERDEDDESEDEFFSTLKEDRSQVEKYKQRVGKPKASAVSKAPVRPLFAKKVSKHAEEPVTVEKGVLLLRTATQRHKRAKDKLDEADEMEVEGGIVTFSDEDDEPDVATELHLPVLFHGRRR